jgi:hypothetical protein
LNQLAEFTQETRSFKERGKLRDWHMLCAVKMWVLIRRLKHGGNYGKRNRAPLFGAAHITDFGDSFDPFDQAPPP